MAELTPPLPADADSDTVEAAFYHEAGLNATWTGTRLAIGGLSFLFGAFVFSYFYLRSLNSSGRWFPAGSHTPQQWAGALIMALVVASALLQDVGLRRVKAGHKRAWQGGALVSLAFGLAAIGVQVWELLNLPFYPGSFGLASVFVGATPVYTVTLLCVLVWLESLVAQAARIPDISFVEQPPTYAEAFALQRFQASLSGLTVMLNYMAAVAIFFWALLYLAP